MRREARSTMASTHGRQTAGRSRSSATATVSTTSTRSTPTAAEARVASPAAERHTPRAGAHIRERRMVPGHATRLGTMRKHAAAPYSADLLQSLWGQVLESACNGAGPGAATAGARVGDRFWGRIRSRSRAYIYGE